MKRPFVDEHGFLRGFPYHDGTLNAVVLTGGTARIGVHSVEGEAHVIALHDLAAFSVDGLREGNILLSMRLLKPSRVKGDAELDRLVRDRLHVDAAKLIEQRQFVFFLECSIGAEVLAVCSKWAVVKGDFFLMAA